jgi:hypothetical protein
METVPFLLGIDYVPDNYIRKYNTLKKKETQEPIKSRYEISMSQRADSVWAKIVPSSDTGGCHYVLIPKVFTDYVVVHSYDGSERHSINYDKYGMDAIKNIIVDGTLTDSERIEKIIGVYSCIEEARMTG